MNAIEEAAIAAVPGGSGLRLAIKLAPFIAIALLVGFILWQRGSLNKANGERDLAVEQSRALGDVVVAQNGTIKQMSQRQIDNDAIAEAVAKRLDTNRAHTEGQRQAIRNANNDPTVRNWADTAVPNSLRTILEADGNRANPAPGGRTKR
jgi:hypothetical protein